MKSGIRTGLIICMLIMSMSLSAIASIKMSVVPDSLKPGEKGTIKVMMSIPKDMHQTYIVGDEEYFYLKAVSPHLNFGKTIYPQPQEKKEGNEWVYHGKIALNLPFTVKSTAPGGSAKIAVEMGYNICFDTGMCEPPETVNKDLTLKIISSAQPAAAATEQDTMAAEVSAVQDTTEKQSEAAEETPAQSIWKFLLMAFIGGLILNIMPCVLPVLSIKAMSIVKQAHEDKSMILKHSIAYTLGILVSFIALAVVIIVLKTAGEAVGWGFQFQNTGFVLGLLSLIFVFALSLFDVFIINAPGMTAATKAGAKGGAAGSFFSGIFAVLLATPCSAPMLGTALGFAFAQPPALILVFFILIGLGLAMPFILLGLNPKLMKVIPKPGEWMNIFKEIMGFLLFATAIWLLHVVYQQNGGEFLLKVIIYLTGLAFAAWMYGRFVRWENSKATQWIFTFLAILAVAGSITFIANKIPSAASENTAEATQEKGFEGWLNFTPELVADLVAKGEPVFIDFGAKWCMTCIANEKTVTTTDEMKAAFASKQVKLVRGDYTKKNPVMLEFMKKFGRAGVPFYVLYIPGKEPKLFPETITIPMLKKALEEIK